MNHTLKVLFLAADSFVRGAPLRTDRELRDLVDAVRKGRGAKALEIVTELAVRPGELQLAIERHDPDVVHFAGHGDEGTGIVMDDNSLVPTQALVRMFRGFPRVRLVVLNACETLPVAKALVKVVDYAVGTNAEIEDSASIAFSAAFYDALASGRTVPEAFAHGTAQIPIVNASGGDTPKLCKRKGVAEGPLVRPAPDVPTPPAPPPGPSTTITVTGGQVGYITPINGDHARVDQRSYRPRRRS